MHPLPEGKIESRPIPPRLLSLRGRVPGAARGPSPPCPCDGLGLEPSPDRRSRPPNLRRGQRRTRPGDAHRTEKHLCEILPCKRLGVTRRKQLLLQPCCGCRREKPSCA